MHPEVVVFYPERRHCPIQFDDVCDEHSSEYTSNSHRDFIENQGEKDIDLLIMQQ